MLGMWARLSISATPLDSISATPLDSISATPLDSISATPLDSLSQVQHGSAMQRHAAREQVANSFKVSTSRFSPLAMQVWSLFLPGDYCIDFLSRLYWKCQTDPETYRWQLGWEGGEGRSIQNCTLPWNLTAPGRERLLTPPPPSRLEQSYSHMNVF